MTVTEECLEEGRAALADGGVHYTWSGPQTGPVVVLVHGFSTPSIVWERNAPSLAGAGYRVLSYDLFGRGKSDRPRTRYTPELFLRQLDNLLETLEVPLPFDLVGLSMGGAIAAGFLARHPEMVRKPVLIAPAGFGELPSSSKLVRIPLFGDGLMALIGGALLKRGIKRELEGDERAIQSIGEVYDEQLSSSGYMRALVSTLRHGPITGQAETYRSAGEHVEEGLLIWGAEDQVVPFEQHRAIIERVPGLRLHQIEGAGHAVNVTHAEQVNEAILTFLGPA